MTLRRTKRNLTYAGLTMFVLIFAKELYSIEYWDTIENYYSNVGNVLPSVQDPESIPKENSIFFHQTSFNGALSPIQACSVEAAARAHPKRSIYVFFSSPVTNYTLQTSCLAKLLLFPNVKLLKVHMAEFAKGTIVESIILDGLKDSRYPFRHAADILKMLTLNKWGGVCLDTDIIIVKPLDRLSSNWIVRRDAKFVAPGIMAFGYETGRNITRSILKEINKTYDPHDYNISGRKATKKVIERICPIIIRWDGCEDVLIYSHELFYPVDNMLWRPDGGIAYYQPSYSFQMWDVHRTRSKMKQKRYEMLVRRYCPTIFGSYREEFGV